MYDFENYTLEDMYVKGRDDAFLYRGNASKSIIEYLSYIDKPGLIKAKISNYIMGYKIGIIELNYKNMGFKVEFDRKDLKLYIVDKKKKVEVFTPELKESIRQLALTKAEEEMKGIIKDDKCCTI